MLKRLWSPTGLLLDDIQFKPGLNLIVGQYQNKDRSGKRQSHGTNGIGKSSIVRLIDYLLLSAEAAKIFHSTKYGFLREQKHEVCLSLECGENVLKIRRSFCDPKKVYLTENNHPEYGYDIDEAKKVLAALFFPQTDERRYPGGNYRNLMGFFIKDDLANIKRDDPISYIRHSGLKKGLVVLLNLYLLGLPCRSLAELLDIWEEEDRLKQQNKVLTNFLHQTTGKLAAQLRSELSIKEKELASLQESLEAFKLVETFKKISETVAEIDGQLVGLRKQEHQVHSQLEKLRHFTQVPPDEIELEETRRQYKAVSLDMARIVCKTLQDVLDFRTSITQERLSFYGNRIRELADGQAKLLEEIKSCDMRRAALLKTIDNNTDMLLSDAWGRYALESAKTADIRNKLNHIEENNGNLTQIQYEALTCQKQIQSAIADYSGEIEKIQILFYEIVAAAFEKILYQADGAYLDISNLGSLKNKSLPVKIEMRFLQVEALGQTKLSTIIYDLTVFLNAIRENILLPDFLVHDGVFHGIETRKKVNLLNYIQKQGENGGFQYIATFNEDEISLDESSIYQGITYRFDIERHTVFRLKDDPKEMLFQSRF